MHVPDNNFTSNFYSYSNLKLYKLGLVSYHFTVHIFLIFHGRKTTLNYKLFAKAIELLAATNNYKLFGKTITFPS